MSKPLKTAINPTREQDYAQWYQEIIKAADLAENSDVRGCMIIKPWGYSIWENMQKILDAKFKETGHKNAYFPLFIPKSFFEKEAQHVEGFAKECAIITHSRLEANEKGGLSPAGKLQEELIVRPTSETIIGSSFAKWINSYRDLPLLINQWANVVRWEKRTRLFLRTSEFLWQEGHTAHQTKEEAIEETLKMLDVYADFAENYLAIPVIKGKKTEAEKFPGAVDTYCIEAMMQDRKALQSGTSHFLGQNFAKSSGIKFQDKNGEEKYVWTTSWGVSTRLIGALIMAHADDNGLVLPPKIASCQVAIIPICKNVEEEKIVLDYCRDLQKEIKKINFASEKIKTDILYDESTFSNRSWDSIKKGYPLRLEIGMKDIEKQSVCLGRRDFSVKEKNFLSRENFLISLANILQEIQDNLFKRACDFRKDNSLEIKDKKEFYDFFTPKNVNKPEIHGGFAKSFWCGKCECEQKIKEDLKVVIRLIPLNEKSSKEGKCVYCGEKKLSASDFCKVVLKFMNIIQDIKNKYIYWSNHQGFRKYFANTSWLFGEKILRMTVGLFVGVWVARYLGPEKFGLFSYAQSFVALF